MKKIIYLIIAVMFVTGTVGCSIKNKKVANSTTPTPKVTFNILRSFGGATTYPTDGGVAHATILKALAADGLGNIDYKVTMIGADYITKLNLLAASDELPDYFNVDMQTMSRFADEGLIQPIESNVNKTTYVKKLMRATDKKAITYNGHMYALPAVYRPEAFNGPSITSITCRQDWLDNLGLQKPKTLDQLHSVLKAFTFNDPDKDGKNDTYGLTGNKNSAFDFVFGAFGIACPVDPTTQDFYFENNGKMVSGTVLPAAKEALTVLAQWYKEGIIDPDFPIMESTQAQEKMINSKVGAYEGSAFDLASTQPLNSSLKKVNPNAKLAMINPPIGPDGKQGMPESNPGYGDLRAINSKCKNVDLLMKLLDWSVNDSAKGGFYLLTYGTEGTDYTYNKQNNTIKQLVSSYDDLYTQGYSNPVRFLQCVDRRWMDPVALPAMATANSLIIKNGFWGTVPAMNDYPDLRKLWAECFVKIVTGKLPVSAWDQYVKDYYKQGGKQVEDQINAQLNKSK